jgi:chemotaxis protein methyltransferase WspC
MSCAAVEDLLRRRIGLDAASAGPGVFARALRSRMKALRIADEDGHLYTTLVHADEAELLALIEEIVVPESWFFRDEQPFVFLGHFAGPWVLDRVRTPMRILSLPCAGGEEPYSIAMTLLLAGHSPDRFRIDAVDISPRLLESARRAVYSDKAFRSKDLEFRDRFFRRGADGYTLDASVRSTVHFHPGNLLDPALLVNHPPYDVIFCRNLLIYFDQPAREVAASHLERMLGPSGVLFVGHADPTAPFAHAFRRADHARSFAFERKAPSDPAARTDERPPQPARPHRSPVRPERPKAVPPDRSRETGHRSRGGEAPAEPSPRAGLGAASEIRSPAAAAIDEAKKLADNGRLAEAAALCEQEIRGRGPSASAFFLLGVIRQAAGDRDVAESFFHKTVYLDPKHEDALMALSVLAQRRGDVVAAASFRRRAGRASQENERR